MPAKGRKRKAKDEPAAAAATDSDSKSAAAAAAGDAPAADKKVKVDAPAAAAAGKSDKDEKTDVKSNGAAVAAAAAASQPAEKKLTEFNEVLCVGSGDMSQLGLGAGTLERKNPAPVKALDGYNVVSVASGALHNAVLLDSGEVWTWGCNDDNALGRSGDEWLPARVTVGLNSVFVTAIACGDCHTLALDDEGEVWSWGTYKDVKGVMGYDAKQEKQPYPALVAGPLKGKKVIAIASGEHHDLALTDKGEVFEWGDTRVGSRGSDRVKRTKLTPQRVVIREKGAKGKILSSITDVWACGMSNYVKVKDGRVFAWGLNNYGQCGVNSRDNLQVATHIPSLDGKNIISITGGVHHSLGLSSDGTVYAWGRSHYGRLGLGAPTAADGKWSDADDKLIPTAIDACAPNRLGADGKVTFIAAGESHSLAVTSNGALYAWGFNELSQLGLGHDNETNTPQRANGQQLTVIRRNVLKASAGSQHSLCLARKVPGAAAGAAPAAAASAAK